MVDGYTAARWRAMQEAGPQPSMLAVGETRWADGTGVRTAFGDRHWTSTVTYDGHGIDGTMIAYPDRAAALVGHRAQVVMVMNLKQWHGEDPQPVEDTQILLETAAPPAARDWLSDAELRVGPAIEPEPVAF